VGHLQEHPHAVAGGELPDVVVDADRRRELLLLVVAVVPLAEVHRHHGDADLGSLRDLPLERGDPRSDRVGVVGEREAGAEVQRDGREGVVGKHLPQLGRRGAAEVEVEAVAPEARDLHAPEPARGNAR